MSKPLLLPAALACAALSLAALPAPASAQARPVASPRIETASFDGVTYAWSILPRDWRVAVRRPIRSGRLAGIAANLRCGGIAMTGGYSRYDDRGKLVPNDLVVMNGRTVSARNGRRDGGFLILGSGHERIVRTRDLPPTRAIGGDAIQSTPILVLDGAVDLPLADERRSNRIAFGRLRDGRRVMIAAYDRHPGASSAVTLRGFAERSLQILGGRLDWLMNFDGGPSVFLATRGRTIVPAPGEITTYLCAEPAR